MPVRPSMLLPLLLFCSHQSINAQPANQGFWVTREVSQGMSESSFLAFAKQNGFEVTNPIAGSSTKSITVDETNYWLTFCDGSLTHASWNLPDNTAFHQSLDKWINDRGFRLDEFGVSSTFDERANKTNTDMKINFKKPGSKYSVTFYQFAENSQIVLEDVRYDAFFNCERDNSN